MSNIADKLFEAAWSNDLDSIRSLAGGSTSIPKQALNSALQAAAYNAKPDACALLLQLGADADSTNPPNNETVLHQAITKTSDSLERTQVVKSLIAHGADVNQKTIPGVLTECFMRDIRTRGETPLHRAAAYGDVDMVLALIDAGADKSAKDINGDSPLTWGSWHLRPSEILGLLLYGDIPGWHGFPNPNLNNE